MTAPAALGENLDLGVFCVGALHEREFLPAEYPVPPLAAAEIADEKVVSVSLSVREIACARSRGDLSRNVESVEIRKQTNVAKRRLALAMPAFPS